MFRPLSLLISPCLRNYRLYCKFFKSVLQSSRALVPLHIPPSFVSSHGLSTSLVLPAVSLYYPFIHLLIFHPRYNLRCVVTCHSLFWIIPRLYLLLPPVSIPLPQDRYCLALLPLIICIGVTFLLELALFYRSSSYHCIYHFIQHICIHLACSSKS